MLKNIGSAKKVYIKIISKLVLWVIVLYLTNSSTKNSSLYVTFIYYIT